MDAANGCKASNNKLLHFDPILTYWRAPYCCLLSLSNWSCLCVSLCSSSSLYLLECVCVCVCGAPSNWNEMEKLTWLLAPYSVVLFGLFWFGTLSSLFSTTVVSCLVECEWVQCCSTLGRFSYAMHCQLMVSVNTHTHTHTQRQADNNRWWLNRHLHRCVALRLASELRILCMTTCV